MDEQNPSRYEDVPGWELSDSFWERIEPLLPKPKSRYRGRGKNRVNIGGRPNAEFRRVMAGILYVLRTGCQWNALPSSKYGSGKTAHRYFQRWIKAGVFRKMWQAGLNEYDEIKGIDWKWQALDGSMTKAPLGGQNTGPNPTDRAKRGTKRSMLVDKDGVPLAVVVAGANKPDGKLLEATLDAVQIEVSAVAVEQHLCLDKGYTAKHCLATGEEHGYTVHVPDKTNAKKTKATARAT